MLSFLTLSCNGRLYIGWELLGAVIELPAPPFTYIVLILALGCWLGMAVGSSSLEVATVQVGIACGGSSLRAESFQ
eukprot:3329133-Amphidinium_carterae.2